VFTALISLQAGALHAAEVKVSEATEACIECHRVIHPGIVADWERSRHSNRCACDAERTEK